MYRGMEPKSNWVVEPPDGNGLLLATAGEAAGWWDRMLWWASHCLKCNWITAAGMLLSTVLRARSNSSFWTSEATAWVYHITGTQSSSLWELGLQWSGSPSGGPCSWEMILFLTAPTRQTLFARHCAKHEAEMNAPTLGSSVQCISLITALWAVCINKHNTISLQNGLGEPMD